MTVRRLTAAASVLAAFLAGGCGGSDGGDGPAASRATPTPAVSPDAGRGARVEIRDFTYRPARISVTVGDRVTWVDRDAANHTVTFEDERQDGIPNLRTGQRKAVRFARPGTHAYVCAYHPNMRGTVVVR